MIYIPSGNYHTTGGVPCTDVYALNARAADIARYVNAVGGSIVSLLYSE